MLVHRRRIASLALTATMFALALGCTPVSLPRFDDGKNGGVGGINGANGTGDGTSSDPTPTPSPTPTPETLNYGTITWQTAGVTLEESVVLTAGALVNNAFVVTGGIREGGGLSRLATSFGINGNGSLSAGLPLTTISVNNSESGICSHGAYVFSDNLILAGGQSDAIQFNSYGVSILRGGTWSSALDVWPTTDPVGGGRQDFGYAQDAGHVFVVGGRGAATNTAAGLPRDSILVADVDPSSGEVSNWRVAGTMPQESLWNSAIVLNGRLYVYGGRTDNGGTVLGTMTSYAIGTDGALSDQQNENATLEAGGNVPPLFGAAIYARNNRLYLVGGMDDIGQKTSTYVTVIRSNGRLASWRTGGALPDKAAQGAFAQDANGHFFLAGGVTTNAVPSNQVFFATVSD